MIWPTSMFQYHARSTMNHFQTISCLTLPILGSSHLRHFWVQFTCRKHGEACSSVSQLLARVWIWFKCQTWSITSCEFIKMVVSKKWRKSLKIRWHYYISLLLPQNCTQRVDSAPILWSYFVSLTFLAPLINSKPTQVDTIQVCYLLFIFYNWKS